MVTRYVVKEDGFTKKDLQDVYLQAFFKEGCEGITRKTLSAYLHGLVTGLLKELENILIQQETSRSEAGEGEGAWVFSGLVI